MGQPSDKVNPFDPLSFWRTSQDATLEAWSKAMIDLVNSEAYSEATARLLDSYLSVSAPMRKLLSQTMAQVLTQLNMPTEAEVTGLAERLTNIEMRLDDLDARLDTIVRTLDTIASAAATSAAPSPRSVRARRDAHEPEGESSTQPAPTRRASRTRAAARGGTRTGANNGAASRRRTRASSAGTPPATNP